MASGIYYHQTTLCLLIVAIVGCSSQQMCDPQEQEPCTCSTPDYHISLKQLMENRGGTPLSVTDKDYTYYISPCNTPLTIPDCQNVDVNLVDCQVDKNNNGYGLGRMDKQTVTGDVDNIVFINSYTDIGGIDRITRLELKCVDTEAILTGGQAQSEQGPLTYKFQLETKYACTSLPSHSSSGLSAGSVLVILFFVAVIIYVVGGVLYLKYVRKANGKEIIPNYEFWSDFPFLVKDGIMFTVRGCKAESTYEQI